MGHLTALEGNGDKKNAAASHLNGELLNLFEQDIEPLARNFALSSVMHAPTMAWKPLVLLLGDHSAGKSSYINNLLGFPLQPEGQDKAQHDFSVITGFRPDNGDESGAVGAIIEEKRGESLIEDELYPFGSLAKFGPSFAKHFTLKKIHLPRLAHIALIDTPPVVGEDETSPDNPDSRLQALGELAALADVIVIFFDPHRPWHFPATYQHLKNTMPEEVLNRKSIFVLNRIDTCTHLHDFLDVYGTLYWRLAQTLPQREIPKVYLTYSKAHARSESSGKKSFVGDLGGDQQALEQAIFAAPVLRLHHMADYIAKQSHNVQLFLQVLISFHKKNSRYMTSWILTILALAAAIGAGTWYLSTTLVAETGNELLRMGLAAGAGLLVFLVLITLINKSGKKSARKKWLENLDQEVVINSGEQRDAWLAINEPLRDYLAEFAHHKTSLKKLKRDLRQVERASQKLHDELSPAIEEML